VVHRERHRLASHGASPTDTSPCQTGPEIGVASTKAFTAPLVDLYMLAILLADLRGTLDDATRGSLIDNLRLVPDLVGQCLDRGSRRRGRRRALKDTTHCLYLGAASTCP